MESRAIVTQPEPILARCGVAISGRFAVRRHCDRHWQQHRTDFERSHPDFGADDRCFHGAASIVTMSLFAKPIYPPVSPELKIIAQKPDETRFLFLPILEFATVEILVSNLPDGHQLEFFDADYPSPSDPGAYFSLARWQGEHALFCGNHGWSSSWQRFPTAMVTRFLWCCRESNGSESIGILKIRRHEWNQAPDAHRATTHLAGEIRRRIENESL